MSLATTCWSCSRIALWTRDFRRQLQPLAGSTTQAGPIHLAVVAHPGQTAEQRANEACGNYADCCDNTSSGESALIHRQAREAVQLSKNVETFADQPAGNCNQNRHDHGPQPDTQALLEPVESS